MMKTKKCLVSTWVLSATLFLSEWIACGGAPGSVVMWGQCIGDDGITKPATGMVHVARIKLSNIVQVASGTSHGLALSQDGHVYGWGSDYSGQATVPSGLSNIVSICAGHDYSMALKDDGTVVGWGAKPLRKKTPIGPPLDLKDVVAIATGHMRSSALTKSGRIVSWPMPEKYSVEFSNVVGIASAGDATERSIAILSDGGVIGWTPGLEAPDLQPPASLSNVVAAALGWNHSLALKRDGTVFGWGANDYGQATGVRTKQKSQADIENEARGLMVINGRVYADPECRASGLVMIDGQILTNVVAIAASQVYSMALKGDGNVVVWGHGSRTQYGVPAGLSGVTAIAAGEYFSLAITTNAAVAERFRR